MNIEMFKSNIVMKSKLDVSFVTIKNRPYANSGMKISVRKEGFLAGFKHDKSNK